MQRPFGVGDLVTFRVHGEDLVMTVAAVSPDRTFVDLEYRAAGGELRRLGIVSWALRHVNGEAARPVVGAPDP